MPLRARGASGARFPADDSLAPKRRDRLLGKTELPQNFLAVFAQPRRPAANEHGCLEPRRGTGLAQPPCRWMLAFDEDAAGNDLRVCNLVLAGKDGSTGNTACREPLQPLFSRARL